jgi:hypothetical protein
MIMVIISMEETTMTIVLLYLRRVGKAAVVVASCKGAVVVAN